jgi:hypothetical protein
MTKTMAGPSGDNYRILIAFMGPVGEDSYRLQSFILDLDYFKKKDEPNFYHLDLTTTDRNLSTGDKKQKILVQRWERSGNVEVKCESNRWAKQSSSPELDTILETVKAVLKIAPADARQPTEFALPPDVSQKVTGVLNSLSTSKLQCVRGG